MMKDDGKRLAPFPDAAAAASNVLHCDAISERKKEMKELLLQMFYLSYRIIGGQENANRQPVGRISVPDGLRQTTTLRRWWKPGNKE